jgi:hypothetical protein
VLRNGGGGVLWPIASCVVFWLLRTDFSLRSKTLASPDGNERMAFSRVEIQDPGNGAHV